MLPIVPLRLYIVARLIFLRGSRLRCCLSSYSLAPLLDTPLVGVVRVVVGRVDNEVVVEVVSLSPLMASVVFLLLPVPGLVEVVVVKSLAVMVCICEVYREGGMASVAAGITVFIRSDSCCKRRLVRVSVVLASVVVAVEAVADIALP